MWIILKAKARSCEENHILCKGRTRSGANVRPLLSVLSDRAVRNQLQRPDAIPADIVFLNNNLDLLRLQDPELCDWNPPNADKVCL